MNKKKRYTFIAISIILVFCEWFFFRNIIGTEAMIGDRGDGRLTCLLTEHWWNFFSGKEKFSEIAMFYPVDEAFGYTDLFLGYGLIHSIFRLFGIDMFASYKYTLILIHIMGTAFMYYLMSRKLKCSVGWSLFGTFSFCFSDTYANHLRHTQLNAISILPLLLILLIGFVHNYDKRKKRNIYAYAFITTFVLLTYTSWYIACFTGVFCLVFLLVFFIRLKKCGVMLLSFFKGKILSIGKDIIGYVICMIIFYIPFIKIYLPVLKSSSGYSYNSCTAFLPEFADIINVSESNLMFGKLLGKMNLQSRGYSSEVQAGFSVILLGLFLLLFVVNSKRNSNNNVAENIFIKVIPDVTFISILVSIFLIIRLSSNGVSLWGIVYYLLPVVRSMRAIARFLIWLSFPMSVITAYAANRYICRDSQLKAGIITCVAVILLFASNINTKGVDSRWNAADEYVFISNVSEPPKDAEVFYIIDTVEAGNAASGNQLDAFEIATWYSMKTINGYSGQFPADWDGVWDIGAHAYESSVYEWIEKYDLKQVYAYDRATNTWIPFAERYVLSMDDGFHPAGNKFSLSTGLQDWNQGEFAWTSENFETWIYNTEINDTGLVLNKNEDTVG